MLFELCGSHFVYAAMLSKVISVSVHVFVVRLGHYMECNISVTGLNYCTNIYSIHLPTLLSKSGTLLSKLKPYTFEKALH
jgi:hypothetical protein